MAASLVSWIGDLLLRSLMLATLNAFPLLAGRYFHLGIRTAAEAESRLRGVAGVQDRKSDVKSRC